METICSAEGCSRRRKHREWCRMHYMRWWRHGDPLKRSRPGNGDVQLYFREVVLAYDGNECLIWPHNRSGGGYAMIFRDGRMIVATRVVCEAAHGSPPSPDHEAAHSCGNGHLACVTKRHLSWKTHAANQADRLAHGTAGAKLTVKQANEIRHSSSLQDDLAAHFGVSQSVISRIKRGLAYRALAKAEEAKGRLL